MLLLQKDDILKRFWGPPKFTIIEKGLPVKDVEQKFRIFVFFRVAQKGPYCLPVETCEQKLGRQLGIRGFLAFRGDPGLDHQEFIDMIYQY